MERCISLRAQSAESHQNANIPGADEHRLCCPHSRKVVTRNSLKGNNHYDCQRLGMQHRARRLAGER